MIRRPPPGLGPRSRAPPGPHLERLLRDGRLLDRPPVVLERHDIVLLLPGQPSRLALTVQLLVFCAVWLVSVPAHGITLILIPRGRH